MFVVLKFELRALPILDNYLTTALYAQPHFLILK